MVNIILAFAFACAVWGGDLVYPIVNYIQDPDEVIDYRGPGFHEPTPSMLNRTNEKVYSLILLSAVTITYEKLIGFFVKFRIHYILCVYELL